MIWLVVTLLGFVFGVLLQLRLRSPLANPTLVATLVVAAALLLSRTPYPQYAQSVSSLTTLLAPAVVALAVPLYQQRALLARHWRALLIGGVSGTAAGVLTDTLLAHWLPVGPRAALALPTAPATSPVALQLAQVTGASPELAATLAVMAGLLGALLLPPFLTLLGVRHPLARGIAIGSVSHGVGTARAREEGHETGAASSIGMGLAAVVVTLLAALLLH